MKCKKIKLSNQIMLAIIMNQVIMGIHEIPEDGQVVGLEFYEHDLDIHKKEQGFYIIIESNTYLDVPQDSIPEIELPVVPVLPKEAEYANLLAFAWPIMLESMAKYPKFNKLAPDMQKSIIKTNVQKATRAYFNAVKDAQPSNNPGVANG